ncbi:MAG: hypothetical protein ACJAS9_003841 [Polaribacter sp.]
MINKIFAGNSHFQSLKIEIDKWSLHNESVQLNP